MPNYQNGKIYAIRSYKTDDIYIGSTIMTLSKRMAKHRVMKTFVSSQLILEHGDAYIELIELCPCNSKEELEKREGELIRATPNTVNMKIAGRTRDEYYADNREVIIEKKKVYAVENKEHIKEYKKEYHELHKEEDNEKRRVRYEQNKEHELAVNKAYREENKDKIAEKSKEYVATNAEKIAAYQKEYRATKAAEIKLQRVENKKAYALKRKEIVLCECGMNTTFGNLTRHRTTKLHKDTLQLKEEYDLF